MRLVRWEPFHEIERLFDDQVWPQGHGFDLAVDVYEKKGSVVAKMQLPGVDPDKVEVTFEDDQHLRIAGSREERQETEEKNYYSREIRQGSFERLVRLPAPVDQAKAEADYNHGVLEITVPKKTETVVDQVKIKIKKK